VKHIGRALLTGLLCLLILAPRPAHAAQSATDVSCPGPGVIAAPADSHLYFVTTRLVACGTPLKFRGERGATGYGWFDRAPIRPGQPAPLHPVLQAEADWAAALRSDIASHAGRALIYVHGYLNSFEDEVGRVQAIRAQSTFDAPILIFSWPSENCRTCYMRDEENALWTQAQFDALLSGLLQDATVSEVVLLAHSMGNRIVLRGVTEADRSLAAMSHQKIRNIILTSPDVDRAIVERDYLPVLSQPGRRTTIYASRADQALRVSWWIHGYPRAGDTRCHLTDMGAAASNPRCPLELVQGEAIVLVDTSLVGNGLLGHADFVESRAAAMDLCRVLEDRATFPGRVAMADHPNSFLLTRDALLPADCHR
jgi:hypothetical protein